MKIFSTLTTGARVSAGRGVLFRKRSPLVCALSPLQMSLVDTRPRCWSGLMSRLAADQWLRSIIDCWPTFWERPRFLRFLFKVGPLAAASLKIPSLPACCNGPTLSNSSRSTWNRLLLFLIGRPHAAGCHGNEEIFNFNEQKIVFPIKMNEISIKS